MPDNSAKRRRSFGLGHSSGLSAEPPRLPRGVVDRRPARIGGTSIRRCSRAVSLRLRSVGMRPMVRAFNLERREPPMAIFDMSASVGAILRMEPLQDMNVPRRLVFHPIRTCAEAHLSRATGRTRADGREGSAVGCSANQRRLLRNADNALIRRSRAARSDRRHEAESETRGGDLRQRPALCEFVKLGELK